MAETPQSPAVEFEVLADRAAVEFPERLEIQQAACALLGQWALAHRALISSTLRAGESNDGWMPIATAPKMKVLLLFAVSDVDGNGAVRNWKMATGSYHTGYVDDEKYSPWEWDGRQLRSYDLQPTHWRPLPLPPQPVAGEVG
jgi:hypothetical protein